MTNRQLGKSTAFHAVIFFKDTCTTISERIPELFFFSPVNPTNKALNEYSGTVLQ